MTSATVATKPAAAQSGQSQAKPEKIRKDHSINWWLTAAVAVLSLTVLVPLYFAVVTALKTPGEAGTFSLPTTWEWHNFADAWNKVNYPKAALNSAIITVCAVVLTLLTNTFVAYAVARNMDKRFFRFLYYFFLAMMFVPFTVVMLPIAKEMGTLHLDNQLGLIILYTILGIGTNLFIAIGFIRSIPISLEEAARIDGASTWRILEDHLPADGTDQRHDRHPDRTVGMERLPAAVDHADRPEQSDDSAGAVRVPEPVHVELSDGLRLLPDGHGPGPHRLHLRPKVGRRWCDERSREVNSPVDCS